AALVALIRNRHLIANPPEDGGDLGVIFENPASILPHVIELRERLLKSLIAIIVSSILSAAITQQIIIVLAEPVGGLEALQAIRVTEPFGIFFRVSITLGIILASPYVIAQLWIFIAAGLKPSERRVFYFLFPFAAFLFIAGVAFAYLAMLPVAVPFLINFMGINATPTLEDYLKFVTNVLLWVGISFEMPLVIFGLAKLKIVNAKMLAENWRIALVLIAVLAAVVTPTPDPINMGIVAAPLFVLYLLSIVLALFA
ncbi:MAG TPA: twin-arginine translocase subunit TatC, partial [Chloroflexi bacterium]|nr:twin-arginine translocase subunit TatC [Chloroflexota bacterium]